MRTRQFLMMVSADEYRMLQELADDSGLTKSDVLRQYIRNEWLRTHAARRKESR